MVEFSRRAFLGGVAAASAEILMNSPALAVISAHYKDAPGEIPNAKLNPEAFRSWYFDRERRFIAAINEPAVKNLLESPLDENFNIVEFDKVMKELLDKWPVAWNEHIKILHEIDPPLAKWARGGLEAEFPSIALEISTPAEKWTANGSLINVDGEVMILTAAHVLKGSPYQYWQADQGDDMVIMRSDEYFKSKNKQRPATVPVLPYAHVLPAQTRGARIAISGHDDGASFRINKKIYIGSGLPLTAAVMFWRLCHMKEASSYRTRWDDLIQTVGEPTAARKFRMKNVRDHFELLAKRLPGLLPTDGILVVLPPGESRLDENNGKPAQGMSGSSAKTNDKVIGVFSIAPDVYIETQRPDGSGTTSLCYSLGVCKTNIGATVESYRSWKRTNGTKVSGGG